MAYNLTLSSGLERLRARLQHSTSQQMSIKQKFSATNAQIIRNFDVVDLPAGYYMQ